ncbi:MAG: TetR/AcrR family transcriptional regulator [Rhizobiaceae bacterium]|nr:TetR/AcrR family transcriptional regulator [Rhizobiaceae bacterium]
MARPLSEEKRNAILASAADAVASLGVSASTAKIAKDAGIAEGTLFVYFPTKDDLINELYLALKADMKAAVATGYPETANVKERCEHLWNRSIDWGARNPAKRKAMRQLSVSDKVTAASRKAGMAVFQDIQSMLDEGFASGILRRQPQGMLAATTDVLTDMTLEFIYREPDKLEIYRRSGFEAYWGAISNK